MTKEIWLPDSKTHVLMEDGQIKVWESMLMTKKDLDKKRFGFPNEEKDEVVLQTN